MDFLAGMLIDRLPKIFEDMARLDNSETVSQTEERLTER